MRWGTQLQVWRRFPKSGASAGPWNHLKSKDLISIRHSASQEMGQRCCCMRNSISLRSGIPIPAYSSSALCYIWNHMKLKVLTHTPWSLVQQTSSFREAFPLFYWPAWMCGQAKDTGNKLFQEGLGDLGCKVGHVLKACLFFFYVNGTFGGFSK